MVSTKLFREFFSSERAGGLALIGFTLIALAIGNSALSESFHHLLHSKLGPLSIEHWVNDALMTIFFLLVGLELEREIYIGELSNLRNALLPIAAAIGGMIVPAAVHLSLNYGLPTQNGAGIPMATDIAFSLGILSLFSNRVPYALKIFLTALAIADDLGAVLVIAIFYTKTIAFTYLGAAIGVFAFLCVLNRMRIHVLSIYLIGGVAMWYFMFHSGIHATITGVLLAFALPFGDGKSKSPSYILQHRLHHPVAFLVLPIFAIVNTSIPIGDDWYSGLTQANSLGIMLGLVVGKPIGILLFSYACIAAKISSMPEGLRWSHLVGASLLAGIGFTMSIFVSLLAFEEARLINLSQIAVLIASVLAAVLGGIWFALVVPPGVTADNALDNDAAAGHGSIHADNA